MSIINVVRYEGPENELSWKWQPSPGSNRGEQIRTGSQLVVDPSQEAIFVTGGHITEVFGPGSYKLQTENLPILATFINIPYGGDSPFEAEVYFINKAIAMDVKWGLVPFNIIEPHLQVPIPVSARGSMALKVADSKAFLRQLIGSQTFMEAEQIKQYFKGQITEDVKTAITDIVKAEKLSPFELESYGDEVSKTVMPMLQPVLDKFGLGLELFNIEGIPVIDSDPSVKAMLDKYRNIMMDNLEEGLRFKRRAENVDIFKTERMMDTTLAAAENTGSNSGQVVGTMLSMGLGRSVAATANQLAASVINPADIQKDQNPCPKCHALVDAHAKFCPSCGSAMVMELKASEVECSNCHGMMPENAKFCPQCGDPYNACSHCKADNPAGAANCIKCGEPMAVACPECHAQNVPGAKFCSGCGHKIES